MFMYNLVLTVPVFYTLLVACLVRVLRIHRQPCSHQEQVHRKSEKSKNLGSDFKHRIFLVFVERKV